MTETPPPNPLEPVAMSAGLAARLKAGVMWNILGAIFNRGGALLVNVIVARILGEAHREAFGQFSVLRNTTLTVAAVAQLAVGLTATKYIAEFRSVNKGKAGRILALCSIGSTFTAVLGALALLVAAGPLAAGVLERPELATGLRLVSAAVLFAVLNGYQVGALAGLEAYRGIARAGIISGIICVAAAWAATSWWGVQGAIAVLVISPLARWAVTWTFLRAAVRREGLKVSYRQARREWPILLRFALPAAVAGLTTMPARWLANAVLIRQPHGVDLTGLYTAADSFRMLALVVPLLISSVSLSIINHLKGLADERRYRKVFWANLIAVAAAAGVLALGMALLAPWVLGAFGKSFSEGRGVLAVLMLSTVPEALAMAMFVVIQSREKMWQLLAFNALPRDVSIVVLAYVLVPRYQAEGLAAAYALSRVVSLVANVAILSRIGLGTGGPKAPPEPPAAAGADDAAGGA